MREGIPGPAPRQKVIHRAKLMNPEGHVSPWCAAVPRPINLKVATWTNRPGAATCPRCIAALKKAGRTP